MRHLLCLGVITLFPPDPVADDGPPRKAAEACLKAIGEKDWKGLAAHTHPDALAKFRDSLVPALKRAAKGAPDNLRDAVALSLLEGVDVEKLLKVPPKEFFAEFVTIALGKGDKRLFAGMEAKVIGVTREGDEAHVVYRARGKVRFAEGSDDDGKGVKKLVLTGDVTRTGVLTVKRSGGAWKALIPAEVQSIADYLNAEWKEK